jgi:hypothetical protein
VQAVEAVLTGTGVGDRPRFVDLFRKFGQAETGGKLDDFLERIVRVVEAQRTLRVPGQTLLIPTATPGGKTAPIPYEGRAQSLMRSDAEILQGPRALKLVTEDYDVQEQDEIVLCDATVGAIAITLPVVPDGRRFTVKKIDSGPAVVTLAASIDGSGGYALLAANDAVTVVSAAGAWHVVAAYP